MESNKNPNMALAVGLWLLTILEALGMGVAGAAKFAGEAWPGMFETWGYPAAFAAVIGVAEMVGALLLLVPRASSYAAMFLSLVMLGALGTLIVTGDPTELGLVPPIIHLGILAVLIRARWTKRWRGAAGS